MKIQELREKNLSELGKELLSLRRTQFGLRLQHRTQQLANTSHINRVRKDIARLKTIIREKTGQL